VQSFAVMQNTLHWRSLA